MTESSQSYPGSTEAGEVCDGCGKLLICRHCGKFRSASVAQAAPMPDLLATTISYSYRTITIECGSLELRDDIYDWLMQKASTLSSTDPRCTCAAIVNPNIPHARSCPLSSTEGK